MSFASASSCRELPTYHYGVTLAAYLSHPIGPSHDIEEMAARADNLENASEWFRFLVQQTRWALMCPWLAYIVAVGNELYGPRALTDQIMLLERCDVLVQVGGYMSPHMTIERNHAERMGLHIVDLTDLGHRPLDTIHVSTALHKRIAEAEKKSMRRRPWLPPLNDADLETLRAAQLVLSSDPFSQDAKDLIQRIVTAAMRR